MSTLVPLSQRDPRWGGKLLGFSKTSTLENFGCTVTCVAMMAGLTPDEVNERLKLVQGFQVDLILWTKIKEAIPWLEFEWRGRTYDEARVKDAISKYGACLVEVQLPTLKHWVVYVGDGKMLDPIDGKQKPTSHYPKATGYTVIKPLSNAPTIPTEPLKWIIGMYSERGIDVTRPEGEIRWKVQDIFDNASKYTEAVEKLQRTERDLAEANGTSAKWEENYGIAAKQNDELRDEIDSLKKMNANLDIEVGRLTTRIESLESQLDPDKVIIITKEEYVRLTASRDIDKYSLGELLNEILKRFTFKS